jgi:hypothetical protein
LSSLQLKISVIKPLLDALQNYFRMHKPYVFQLAYTNEFNRILKSISYFKEELGYKLFINIENADDLIIKQGYAISFLLTSPANSIDLG